ncbi:MAG: response regulator [Candidatus Bathyarchaeota archaeon]|nr:response regulator [Candidatus Bathyarchaeota archaeon]
MIRELSKVHPDRERGKVASAKILVIEDDAGMREVLTEILAQEGYQVKTASDGKVAISLCQHELFDVVLIDIKLPDMEGTKLLEVIKKLSPGAVKIMVTGHPSLESAVECLNLGADGYIVKPFKPVKFLEQIKQHLERRQRIKWAELLMKTGLSEYESRVYLALALEGCSEARKLSMSSGVPRTKTYAALKKLAQRGLVVQVPGEKQSFSITAPSGAFNALLQTWKKELSEQAASLVETERVISVLDSLHKSKQVSEPVKIKKEETWSIKGRSAIYRRISEMLSRAKNVVTVATTGEEFMYFYKRFNRLLDDLSGKGVQVKVQVPTASLGGNLVSELKVTYSVENVQVSLPVLFIDVDNSELLVSTLATQGAAVKSEEERGLFFEDSSARFFFSELLGLNKQN